ncbi:LacI family DNA-binding transcriptional regulator [Streptomyces daghestanicus]|jgi:DNA-binding LacI/PurR family transcriptional regulator|uniref:LacI family transcriptional regulator n=1 Tax=Streptomyces daghestanicus TaxID=66885 RepID=A0ABQ3Q9H5_9ACTN|nr:LacI family DNA-binding transcriptional regulator [Streptomyces daghestanicus]GGU68243.1 LacI family transcriptional regulator [Streptomyces daghestanicus]GHI33890.1 LacI family transcriptional regulator [Streptomyces daghestanicus]
MARITDVARRAGVSPSTVSYALSGKRPISAETRRRVEAAVRELGYRPHTGGPTGVLGLLLPLRTGLRPPPELCCAMAVVTAARAHERDVLLITGEDGERALRRVADALIVMDVRLRDPRLPSLRDRPSVLIGVPAEPAGLTCVDLDFRVAAERCVARLAELGHRVVALVGAPPEEYARHGAAAHRVLRGFTAAADRAGLLSSVHPSGHPTGPDAALETAGRLLRLSPAPTAVVVHNEPLLLPLLDALARLGRRVPQELSVVAICADDVALTPRTPVTSVTVPAAELGTRAVDLAVRALAGTAAPGVTLLPPRLTDRATTAPRA